MSMFQPAFFSGSLVDLKRRMEFLSKMTRPANNNSENGGFSFTKPPVCHLRLGDWFNHDIIVEDVSYDYSESTWSMDSNFNQPICVLVSVAFNIVGCPGDEPDRISPTSTLGNMFGSDNSLI